MNKQQMKKTLQAILKNQYFDYREYQDKYYLSKEIQEKIPELDEVSIYKAIDYASRNADPLGKINKFIDAFIEKVVN
ncbi:MAG TPA: hypothetical protein VHO03_20435 [Ignavibacteriales bacterium]|nr:hypothetical protein [Ignavibacteriales bacterium]